MDKEFEVEHEGFIQGHQARRSGERKERLNWGNGHGEKLFLKNVWWPLYRNFEHLHPEYEVLDWRGRPYFGDFAFLPGQFKLIIEIKGYGPHVRDMGRKKYCNELNRELYLQTLGYRIASFAYDDVDDRPELCRSMLDFLLRRYLTGGDQPSPGWKIAESEVIRLALGSPGPIRPKQVALHLQISNRTAGRYLQSLCSKGILRPVSNRGSARIHFYELIPGKGNLLG